MKHSVKAAAAAVLLAVALTGCAQVEQVRSQGQDVATRAEQLWTEAQEFGDLSLESLQNFDWSSLEEYNGIFLGDASAVSNFFRSMPSGPDIEGFEIKGEEGKLIVNYGEQVTEVDPAVLQQTMEDVAAQAKEHVQNLETVEFRVGDQTYTF